MNAYELYRKTIRLNTTKPKLVHENGSSVLVRNAYIEEFDNRSGSTRRTFSKNLFHSLVALGSTNKYQELEDDPLERIFYKASLSREIMKKFGNVYDKSSAMGRNFSLLSASKKLKQADINTIINIEEIEINSPSVSFLLYFMISFSNLNSLIEDFQKIYLKPSTERWEKTGYIHQSISEIYREEFLFALLLEFLNVASFGWDVCTVTSIDKNDPDAIKFQKIYNAYLNYYSDRFHKYYEYKNEEERQDEQYNSFIYYGDENILRAPVFDKTVRGTLEYPNYDNKHYSQYSFPDEVMHLSEKESKQALSFILELFVLSVNPELISKVTSDDSIYGSPCSIEKYNMFSIEQIVSLNNKMIDNDYVPDKDVDVYISQQERTLRNISLSTANRSELIHYYINPKIKKLITTFTSRHKIGLKHPYRLVQINL